MLPNLLHSRPTGIESLITFENTKMYRQMFVCYIKLFRVVQSVNMLISTFIIILGYRNRENNCKVHFACIQMHHSGCKNTLFLSDHRLKVLLLSSLYLMMTFPNFTSQLMSTIQQYQIRFFTRIYNSVSIAYLTLKH